MSVPFWGFLIFLAGLAVHFVVWKIWLPRRQAKAILQILLSATAAALPVLALCQYQFDCELWFPPRGGWDYVHILLLDIVLALAYLNTYPGIEADSPTLVMMLTVDRAGPQGLAQEYFSEAMNDDLLVKPRINDLVLDRMAYVREGRYYPTRKGRVLATLFAVYRKLIKASKGG